MSSRLSLVSRHVTSSALSRDPVIVTVTGAAGQIGYALVFMIAQGRMFGASQKVELRLLELPIAAKALEGVVMELIDCAYPLVSKIVATTDATVAFRGSQYGLLVGAKPRGPGMERKDLLTQNAMIFKVQGAIVDKVADKNIKIVVVGNPANTNALILSKFAPSIPKENITSLTRLDQNRAVGQIAEKVHVPVTSVRNLIIWGNHSTTQFPDINQGVIDLNGYVKPIRSVLSDDAWVEKTFIPTVQKRGAKIIELRKASSAASAASSICDHMHDWVCGTAPVFKFSKHLIY